MKTAMTNSTDIYLHPWGLYWKDMEEDAYPYRYTDWYLSVDGKSMPDAIGEGVSEECSDQPDE